jgi:hypothetical protein
VSRRRSLKILFCEITKLWPTHSCHLLNEIRIDQGQDKVDTERRKSQGEYEKILLSSLVTIHPLPLTHTGASHQVSLRELSAGS